VKPTTQILSWQEVPIITQESTDGTVSSMCVNFVISIVGSLHITAMSPSRGLQSPVCVILDKLFVG
jgi:hypothetical protein